MNISTKIIAVVLIALLSGCAYVIKSERDLKICPYPDSMNTEWDWDLVYSSHIPDMWMCRGVQKLNYVESCHCYGKPKTDTRWPGM